MYNVCIMYVVVCRNVDGACILSIADRSPLFSCYFFFILSAAFSGVNHYTVFTLFTYFHRGI